MSRDNAPRRWWSGQWLMVLLGLVAASILFRFVSDRGGWFNNGWFNNLGGGLGFLSANSQPYQTVNTGASVEASVPMTIPGAKLGTDTTPPPPDPIPQDKRYPRNGYKGMW